MDVTIMAGYTHGHFSKIRKPRWVESQETGVPQETSAWPSAGLRGASRSVFPNGKAKEGIRSTAISGRNCSEHHWCVLGETRLLGTL